MWKGGGKEGGKKWRKEICRREGRRECIGTRETGKAGQEEGKEDTVGKGREMKRGRKGGSIKGREKESRRRERKVRKRKNEKGESGRKGSKTEEGGKRMEERKGGKQWRKARRKGRKGNN